MSATTIRDGRLCDMRYDVKHSHICLIQVGTYSGDGSTDQTITTNFDPLYVRIWKVGAAAAGSGVWEATTDFTAGVSMHDLDGDTDRVDNALISLGTLCFHVDDAGADADPNANGIDYCFLALGELT
jgi:hypothetical protein